MFTVLSNTRNANLFVIVALATVLVLILSFAVVPSLAAPKPALIPVTGGTEYADYYQRHPEQIAPAGMPADEMSDYFQRHTTQRLEVPVTGNSTFPDYFQRHSELSSHASAGITVDMSDYFMRHPDLRLPAETLDLSDYFLRH